MQSPSRRSGKSQLAKCAGHVKVRGRRASRLPCHVEARLFRSLNAIKICPPNRRGIKMRGERFKWDRQLCGPAMRFIVQHNRTLQTAFQVRDATRENVEIDPHAVRTDLELFIIALARRIGLQECLSHVAIPKMIAPAGRLSIFEDGKLPVPRIVSMARKGNGTISSRRSTTPA